MEKEGGRGGDREQSKRGEKCHEGEGEGWNEQGEKAGNRKKRGQEIKGEREGGQERIKCIRVMYEKRGEEEI